MSEPLKPCPFCGQERWIMLASGSHWGRLARCAGLHPDDKPCGASGPLRDDDDQAIAAWNRRAPPPHPLRTAITYALLLAAFAVFAVLACAHG